MEESLKSINNLLSNKFSTVITISSPKSDILVDFPIPLTLKNDLNYEMGLIYFSTYNAIYNITSENNSFEFKFFDGMLLTNLTIQPGAYEIPQLSNEINNLLIDYASNKTFVNNKFNQVLLKYITEEKEWFKLTVDLTSGRCKISHKLFEFKGKMMSIIGFKNNTIYAAKNLQKLEENKFLFKENKLWSSERLNITDIETINIECNLIQGSYINGESSNILYTFPAFSVPLGYKIIEKPFSSIYFPLNVRTISEMRIKVIDQKERLINFNGEIININLHLRQV